MKTNCFSINNIEVGLGKDFLLIAGPCQIESETHCLKIAEKLQQLFADLPVNLVFKSSYDKANRTSQNSPRGVGLEEGLRILDKVKKEVNLPVLTDIHDQEQCLATAEIVDILQIPAFLCRQTDLLVAAGKTGRAINIKKGQFLAANDMLYAAEKVTSTGNGKVMLCERGTCFGYRDLVVDFRNFQILNELAYPVIFDATHSVQIMGGAGGQSAGQREYVSLLAKAAATCPIAGLFIETHDDPDSAPSDGPNMIALENIKPLVESVLKIKEACL